jgi:hypothetical protein
VSKIDDGGPIASSLANKTQIAENTYCTQVIEAQGGLSLRDYFAAAALQGWLASWPEQGSPHPSDNDNALNVAKLSYKMADAMLAARKEGV